MSQVIWNILADLSEEMAGFQTAIHHERHGGAFSDPRFCPDPGCVYACNTISMIGGSQPDDIDSIGMNDFGLFIKRDGTERAYGICLNLVAWGQTLRLEEKKARESGFVN